MWAVLTDSHTWEEDAFFTLGAEEINAFMALVRALWPQLAMGHALDFGSGVGRLSQALATHFERVHGVDIAPSMVEAARLYNRHGERVRYTLNCHDDLRLFTDSSFDFIYSNITLQHIRPAFAQRYIKEFTRVLRPMGGLAIQIPSHLKERHLAKRLLRSALPPRLQDRYRIAKYEWRARRGKHEMEMHGLRRPEVERLLRQGGMRILSVVEDKRVTAHHQWASFIYIAAKA